MEHEVIIIGVTHHNTLSMVRSIGQCCGGVHLILYNSKRNSYVSKSKYILSVVYAKDATECINILLQRKQNRQGTFVISCTDQIAQQIDSHQNALVRNYYFFHSKHPGNLTCYMNKQKQLEMASYVGIKTPYSIVLNKSSLDSYKGKFPCIIKPVESYKGGKQVFICNNHKELVQKIPDLDNIEWQVQEFIAKEKELVVAGVAVNGDIIMPGVIEKYRELKGGTSYSIIYPTVEEIDEVLIHAKEMIKLIGYEGLFGFEFIFDGSDYYFLELNLRNDATTYTYKIAGVDLPGIYLKGVCNEDYSSLIKPIRKIESMVEFVDFHYVKSRQINLFAWLKDYYNCKCKYFFDRHDIKPFLFALYYTITKKI